MNRPYSKDMGFEDLDVSAVLHVRLVKYSLYHSYIIDDYVPLITVSILSLFNRCLPGYPYKCPKLHITPEKGLLDTDADKLLSLLHDQVVVESDMVVVL